MTLDTVQIVAAILSPLISAAFVVLKVGRQIGEFTAWRDNTEKRVTGLEESQKEMHQTCDSRSGAVHRRIDEVMNRL